MNNNIQLLQSYYRFLSLGKYLEFLIQSKDFSTNILDIAIDTGERSHFGIKSSLVKTLLKKIHENPDQKNIFGYLVEISSFRGIFGIMRELVDNNDTFKKFVMSKLNDQYFAFEQVIRLTRNILSHTTTADILIKTEDFAKQKDFLIYEKKSELVFDFSYAKHWDEWKGNKNYGIVINIDFEKLKEGSSLFAVIPLHQLYLLSELCNNLCEIFRLQYPTKKTSKTIGKRKSKT